MSSSGTHLKRKAASIEEGSGGAGSPALVSQPYSVNDLSISSSPQPPATATDTAGKPSGSDPEPSARTSTSDEEAKNATVKRKSKWNSKGRHGDPRMHKAVMARLLNPEITLLEALLEGGFTFPDGVEGPGKIGRNIYDSDGVLLSQRKNALSRRLQIAKKRQLASRVQGEIIGLGNGKQDDDTRIIQTLLLNGKLPKVAGTKVPMTQQPLPPLGNVLIPAADQYAQLPVGFSPEKQLQTLQYSGNIYPAFQAGANNYPFQQFSTPHQAQPQNFFGRTPIDPQTATGFINPGINLPIIQTDPVEEYLLALQGNRK